MYQHKPMEGMFIYSDKEGTLVCRNCTKCGILKSRANFMYKSPNRLRSTCRDCDNLSYRIRYQRKKLNLIDEITGNKQKHIDYWVSLGIPLKCYICSGPFEEIEHVRSIGLGGSQALSNTLPACSQCNRGISGKRDRPICEWLRKERPEYLSLVLAKVLLYGVDPFTPCEKVIIGSGDELTSKLVIRDSALDTEYMDITDDIMEKSYENQRTMYAI